MDREGVALMDVCVACGKPIFLGDPTPWIISLNRAWMHYSRRANRNHGAIHPSMLRGQR